jgi:hypothetical protein
MFCATVSHGNRRGSWNMKPISGIRAAAACRPGVRWPRFAVQSRCDRQQAAFAAAAGADQADDLARL